MAIRLRGSGRAVALLLLSASRASCQCDPEWSLAFADHLLQQGEYFRAVTEYRRCVFFAGPGDASARERAILGAARAMCRGGDFAGSRRWLQEYLGAMSPSVWRAEAKGLLVSTLVRLRDSRGLTELAQAWGPAEAPFLQGIARAVGYQWSDARRAFSAVRADSKHHEQARRNAAVARRAQEASFRSRQVAGLLGVIPGAGYLYAGHRQSALSALTVTVVFVASGAAAFRSDQAVLGSVLAVLSLTWYGGSIYGSMLAADRHNGRMHEAFLSDLEYW